MIGPAPLDDRVEHPQDGPDRPEGHADLAPSAEGGASHPARHPGGSEARCEPDGGSEDSDRDGSPAVRTRRGRAGGARDARVPVPRTVLDGGIFPRRKDFRGPVSSWRRRAIERVRQRPDLFRRAGSLGSLADLRSVFDEDVAALRVVARILSAFHGDPRLGNPEDAVDELVYILLNRSTPIRAAVEAYRALKAEYRTWQDLLDADDDRIASTIRFTGLGTKKVRAIRNSLERLKARFGEITLAPTEGWSDREVADFLTSMDEVGPKSAFCVMMYSLGRPVFPTDTHSGRVLARIGIFRGLGLDLTPLHRKVRQEVLEDLVPPDLRYALHVNLVAHGREVCTAQRPRCGACPVNRFCAFYRAAQVREAESSTRPTVVDLFCGAGGLSDGFRQGGFRTVLAVDQNPVALRTFRLNHPEVREDRVLCEDLRDFSREARRLKDLLGDQEVDVLLGGPPCQGFSRAGWRSRGSGPRFEATEDDRNHLFQELISLLGLLNPKVVVMENVPGIGEVRFPDGTTFQGVTEAAMRQLGYEPRTWTLNAAYYGVPQMRFRRVIVGTRLPKAPPDEPEPQYWASSNQFRYSRDIPLALLGWLEPPISVQEAIGDLPPLGTDDGAWVIRSNAPAPGAGHPSRFLARYRITHPQGLLFSHKTRFQNPSDLERFAELRPGDTYMDLLSRRPELRNYRTDAFDDKYFRLHPGQPSRTIVAHLRKDGNSFVHPTQVRSLSVREAARLQSFDDAYIFTGSRGDQFEQIGNAVPPLMGAAMARRILEHLGVPGQQGGDPGAPTEEVTPDNVENFAVGMPGA